AGGAARRRLRRRGHRRARARRRQPPPLPHVPWKRRQPLEPSAEDARPAAHRRRLPPGRRTVAIPVPHATLSRRPRRAPGGPELSGRLRGANMSVNRILAAATVLAFAAPAAAP